ncbi:hypothetical protein [Amycolatopsis magusensis]|uniref:Uncharacterized protein n=1 Tax=Amycolatopsis magusensis TaxID=882444 RepID=A0ABS4PKQ5_9PSEU|nr:hypothetical protein [Amycolatopsis magusensis]MBP2179480.1 hypothetical protein [Amycolatopsis magusensis]
MRPIEFVELRGDPVADGESVRLAGRCYQGPIQVGDVFTEAAGQEVRLRVDGILFYGKPVPELHPSESGQLTLTGDGLEHVVAGVSLRGAP